MKVKGGHIFFIITIAIGLLVCCISSLGSKHQFLFLGLLAIYTGVNILVFQKNKNPDLISPHFRLRKTAYVAVLAGILFVVKYFS
jgi:hypothetical protein